MDNSESLEEEFASQDDILSVPKWFKTLVVFIVAPIIIGCIYLYVNYILDPNSAAPDSLGLPTILVFCMAVLFLALFPWKALGLRITKIGPLEVQRVVKTQIHERDEQILEMEKRISDLEGCIRDVHEGLQIGEMIDGHELRDILIDFLSTYAPKAFSPIKIQAWGAKQKGFEKLSEYSLSFVRRTLRQLFLEEVLTTTISKSGNTLYKINN
jgi:hypothetical protein